MKFPSPILIDVGESGEATFVVTNGGKHPFALEYIAIASKNAVLMFDLSKIELNQTIINNEDVSLYKAALDIDISSEDDAWQLLKLFHNKDNCVMQAGVITPNGKRIKKNVNASTIWPDETDEEKNVPFRSKI